MRPFALALLLTLSAIPAPLRAADPAPSLFRRDNLMAWCIVPFDAKRRGPEERAEMLSRLGFKHFAYDYRAEHVPTFEAEILALKKQGVSLDAWWFPGSLNDEAKGILALCQKHDVHPQLWITGGGGPAKTPEEQTQRVAQEAARIRPLAEAAAKQGMKIGLYNHGGWFGEPENQLAIIQHLKLDNVGIVYNLHHGHDHLDRLAAFLPKILPHLLVLNLNGMTKAGDKTGRKILQLGQGDLDLAILRTIRDSGYRGPIGILGHTQDDAEARLQDNLDGLDWLLPQLDGAKAGPQPKPRTPVPGAKPVQAAPVASPTGYLAAGRAEYRTPPLTVELQATLRSKQGYNILVACDPKSSAAHWELFTMPGSGHVTAYLPGAKPDHVRATIDICDQKPHRVAMVYEPARVRLFVDGKLAAEQAIERKADAPAPSGLAFGRLVEGGIGCDGALAWVRLTRGVVNAEAIAARDATAAVTEDTLGLWTLGADAGEVRDLSKAANHAKRVASAPAAPPSARIIPPPGVHLKPTDPKLKAVLIDRSPDDVYMGVKVDTMGRVFVGGREAVFVFEPQPDGGYRRQELLRFPAHSIIMGLEFRGHDLYVLTANALYLVPDGCVKRENLAPQRILWGLPLDLHVSFHSLAWGPEGDLYLTHGDPLLNYGDWNRPDHWAYWTLYCGKDNQKFPYTGQGAVLAVRPDGTQPRVIARGLRGPVGLAFDVRGDLFTNDNDHESRADQYAPMRLLHVLPGADFGWPRGWMAEKSPERFDLLETMHPNLGRGVPCDLVWYHESFLPGLEHRLLLARWDLHAVTAYDLTRRGISYQAKESVVLSGSHNARPVGVTAGRDGRLFVTCLYMAGNMASPACVSDLVVVTRADDTAAMPFDPHDLVAQTDEELKSASSFDERLDRRWRAWSELQRRGKSPGEKEVSKFTPDEKRINPETLVDASSTDTYRRQRGVRSFLERAGSEDIARLLSGDDEPRRLAAVLAIGRKLTVPEADFVPPEKLALFYPAESSFFKRRQTFLGVDRAETKPIDLADLGRIGSFTIAQWWAVVDRTPEHNRLFDLLVRAVGDESPRVQSQAAYFLSLLNDPRSEPLVAQTKRDAVLRRIRTGAEQAVARLWVLGPLAAEEKLNPSPEQGAIDLTARYETQAGRQTWREAAIQDESLRFPAGSEKLALYASFRVQSAQRQPALIKLPGKARLWLTGSEATQRANAADAAQAEWIVDLQPGSNDVLVRLQSATGSPGLAIHMQAPAGLEVTLPEKLDSALLAERLRAAAGTSESVGGEFLKLDWNAEAPRGDAAAGRKLFGALACAKCHAVTADGKGAGAPSLFEAKRRFTVSHLVESILLPTRQIAEPFRGATVTTVEGQVVTGLVVQESATELELLLPDASRRTLAKTQIEERVPAKISPMPQGLVKTPEELRHLLAYLLSERPLPP